MSEVRELIDLLETGEEITIICHTNPDPDCLASALALGRIAAYAGIDERRIVYTGTISHQQNRAFVNLLEIDIQPYDDGIIANRTESSLLAFVDHARPSENNEVPPGTPIDIVIDHHDVDDVAARYVDHRPSVGATATILTEYVTDLNLEIDATVATALLFAIRRETLSFLRGTTSAEYKAASELHSSVDLQLLRTLSMPSVSGQTIDAIATAIQNRIVRSGVLLTHIGRSIERDALPQAADYLASLEGVDTVIVYGIVESAIELSARTTDTRVHIGHVLNDAFDDVGKVGGHREMGGGSIPLGILAEYSDEEVDLITLVQRVVTDRLIETMHLVEDKAAIDTSDQK